MFGTLQPGLCGLDRHDRGAYRRAYCGMCKSMSRYGLSWRALVNHDLVLYALAVEGLQREEDPGSTCRCPIAPWIHRPIASPSGAAMRAVAALQVLFADQWLADKAEDGRAAAAPLRRLLPTHKALALAESLDLDAAAFATLCDRQTAVEADPHITPLGAAAPTAALLAGLFQNIATLPGCMALDAAAREHLHRLGHGLGEVVYFIDALEDVHKDRRKGHFNPLLVPGRHGRELSEAHLRELIDALDTALVRIRTAVAHLPWQRGGDLLTHILSVRLPHRAERALKAVRPHVATMPVVVALAVAGPPGLSPGHGALATHDTRKKNKPKRGSDAKWCCVGECCCEGLCEGATLCEGCAACGVCSGCDGCG